MEFNTFDVSVFGVILGCILLSTSRGMVAELFDFFGWIFALILARVFASNVASAAFPNMQPESMAILCAFVLVFILTRIFLHLLNYALNHFIHTSKLSRLNRLLGAVLGMLKGILFVTLGVFVLSFSDLPKSREWQTAFSSRFFERNVEIMASYMPTFLGSQIHFPKHTANAGAPPAAPKKETLTPNAQSKKSSQSTE